MGAEEVELRMSKWERNITLTDEGITFLWIIQNCLAKDTAPHLIKPKSSSKLLSCTVILTL
jgi:hypothetical protein